MTYSAAHAAEVGQYLYSLTGIAPTVGTAWALDESGAGNNPYGVTDGAGHLYTYPTWQAGVSAAAHLLRAAYQSSILSSVTGSPAQQAEAILSSPWNRTGGYLPTSAPNLHAIAQGGVSARGLGTQTAAQNNAGDQGGSTATAVSGLGGLAAIVDQLLGGQGGAIPYSPTTQAGLSWLDSQVGSGIGGALLGAFVAVLPLLVLLFLGYKALQLLTET